MSLAELRSKHAALAAVFTERSRRLWAATEARALGYGGAAFVARATGIAASTVRRGLRELATATPLPPNRTRQAAGGGSGRPSATRRCCATLMPWSNRRPPAIRTPRCGGPALSARTLAVALDGLGHRVSHTVVAELFTASAIACRGTSRAREGRQHADRDAEFRYIARRVRAAQRAGQPTIAVDTKRKELVGDFKNAGRTWRPGNTPQRVQVHDFVIGIPAGGKAILYGVIDLHRNEGWVSVGIDHDTATFAVQSIRRWWRHMGRPVYRQARSLVITADAGGSNGARLASGNGNCSSSPRARGSPSPCVTSHPAPASGTRLSIACSRTSP